MRDTSEIRRTASGYSIIARFEWDNPPRRVEKVFDLGDCPEADAREALDAARQLIAEELGGQGNAGN